MRRRLAGAAAVGLALVLLAPTTWADSVPASMEGTKVTSPTVTSSPAFPINATVHRKEFTSSRLVVKAWFTTPDGLPAGCPAPGEVQVATTVGPGPAYQDGSIDNLVFGVGSAPCNGRYGIRVHATIDRTLASDIVAEVSGSITVLAAPGPVADLSAVADGNRALLSWPALASPPPDFVGYRVLRFDAGGPVAIGDVGKDQLNLADTPPLGGSVTYQVLALRSGPDTLVPSTSGPRATVDLPIVTTPTGPGTDGGADGGTAGTDGGTAGTDGGVGADGGTAGADGGTAGTDGGTVVTQPTSGRGRSFAPLPRGQVGVGTKAPRLGVPSQSNVAGLLDDDTFDPEIDYGSLGEDGLSSVDYEEDGENQRGMAIPVATGFVFAAWAFHLRYLAKAAKTVSAVPAGRRVAPRRPTYR